MAQLLFLDTFSHEVDDLNLDLVQFPSSVIVEEVRVIPLGGKVHLSGKNMRLGATLPNKFNLEFFVNDLTKPMASTFSSLGKLDYDHDGQICLNTTSKKIRTDGLVLRGHYSAVTLAVYGNYTPTTAEQLASLSAPASAPEPEPVLNNQDNHPPPPPATAAQSHHHMPMPPTTQKRNDWSSSWPPPVTENCQSQSAPPPAPNVAAASDQHYGALNAKKQQQQDWKMGNGQRSSDEFYEHHQPRQQQQQHHHVPPPSHKHHHSMPRPRSPLQRESRSGTR